MPGAGGAKRRPRRRLASGTVARRDRWDRDVGRVERIAPCFSGGSHASRALEAGACALLLQCAMRARCTAAFAAACALLLGACALEPSASSRASMGAAPDATEADVAVMARDNNAFAADLLHVRSAEPGPVLLN